MTPVNRIEAGDLGLIFALLKCTSLLAFVPQDSALAAALAGQTLIVPVDVPAVCRDLVAWHRADDNSPYLARLVHHLAAVARKAG